MAHVQIRTNDDGRPTLVVDGTDIAAATLREGFAIVPDDLNGKPVFRVQFQVIATDVDFDLPDAILEIAADGTGGPAVTVGDLLEKFRQERAVSA